MADPWGTLAPSAWTRAVMSHPLSAAVYNAYQQGDRAGILGMVPENVRRAWSPWLLPLASPVAFMDTFSPGAAVRDTLHASGDLARAAMRGDPWGALGAAGMGLLSIAGVVPWLAPAKVATTPTQGATRAMAPVAATEGRGPAKALVPELLPLVPPPAGVQNSSRSARIYDSLPRPQRPFSEDYRTRARSDATDRLTHDIEGRELTADWVVGRRMVGGPDEAFPQTPAAINALAEALTGQVPENVSSRLLRGDAGRYREGWDPVTGDLQRGIALSKALRPEEAPRVLNHEIGHAISRMAADIPTEGIETKLRQVYNDLNARDWRVEKSAKTGDPVPQRYWIGPEHQGYTGAHIPRELMAEAIRAYMTDPNYLKTVAPKVAERIRAYANPDPQISRVLQFNSMLPAAASFGALMPWAVREEVPR